MVDMALSPTSIASVAGHGSQASFVRRSRASFAQASPPASAETLTVAAENPQFA
jgi:hypothetical protein